MISVAGIPMFSGTMTEAVDNVVRHVCNRHNVLVSATGAHGIVHARRNPEFRSLLHSFGMNLPDGMPAVWIGRLKGARRMERCYGPRFFELVMRESAGHSIRHFLCGGKEGVPESLKAACATKFGNHNIVGTYSPPFRDMDDSEMEQLGKRIMATRADVVWIGLSTPKQERFGVHLSRFVQVSFIVTVGAAFDFHTGRVRQAPALVQKIGLEWFFRLVIEPKRLWRRYVEAVPMFLYLGLIDLFQFWIGAGKPNESK